MVAALAVHGLVALLVLLAPSSRPVASGGEAIRVFALPRLAEPLPRHETRHVEGVRDAAPPGAERSLVPLHGDKAKPPAGSFEGSVPLPALVPAVPSAPAVSMMSAPAVPSPKTTPSADEPSRLQAYQQILWAQIAAHRPRATRMAGTVRVRFQLDHGGALISCEVTKSSGLMLLDGIALRSVRQASPFPAPPEELAEDALQFEVPVTFGRERPD